MSENAIIKSNILYISKNTHTHKIKTLKSVSSPLFLHWLVAQLSTPHSHAHPHFCISHHHQAHHLTYIPLYGKQPAWCLQGKELTGLWTYAPHWSHRCAKQKDRMYTERTFIQKADPFLGEPTDQFLSYLNVWEHGKENGGSPRPREASKHLFFPGPDSCLLWPWHSHLLSLGFNFFLQNMARNTGWFPPTGLYCAI